MNTDDELFALYKRLCPQGDDENRAAIIEALRKLAALPYEQASGWLENRWSLDDEAPELGAAFWRELNGISARVEARTMGSEHKITARGYRNLKCLVDIEFSLPNELEDEEFYNYLHSSVRENCLDTAARIYSRSRQ
jgi:hypothetical protein